MCLSAVCAEYVSMYGTLLCGLCPIRLHVLRRRASKRRDKAGAERKWRNRSHGGEKGGGVEKGEEWKSKGNGRAAKDNRARLHGASRWSVLYACCDFAKSSASGNVVQCMRVGVVCDVLCPARSALCAVPIVPCIGNAFFWFHVCFLPLASRGKQ